MICPMCKAREVMYKNMCKSCYMKDWRRRHPHSQRDWHRKNPLYPPGFRPSPAGYIPHGWKRALFPDGILRLAGDVLLLGRALREEQRRKVG